jgi:hydroxypyruvate reductase
LSPGAGKAAAAMAKAVEDLWSGPLSGLVITRYGHGTLCSAIEVVEAGHPVPDEKGQAAAQRMLSLVRGLTEDDMVLCLISGGGSSLLAVPAPGITLEDKQGITRALLKSGAPISEINCVRKHLSAVKGGRLARGRAGRSRHPHHPTSPATIRRPSRRVRRCPIRRQARRPRPSSPNIPSRRPNR